MKIRINVFDIKVRSNYESLDFFNNFIDITDLNLEKSYIDYLFECDLTEEVKKALLIDQNVKSYFIDNEIEENKQEYIDRSNIIKNFVDLFYTY